MPIKKNMHPNSLKNLEKGKFTKGMKHKHTPGRKPGSVSLHDSLKRAMEMEFEQLNETSGVVEKRQIKDWIGIALAAKAMRGDVQAAREILDRLEGRAAQRIEVAGDGLKVEHTINMSEVYKRAQLAFDGVLLENDNDE